VSLSDTTATDDAVVGPSMRPRPLERGARRADGIPVTVVHALLVPLYAAVALACAGAALGRAWRAVWGLLAAATTLAAGTFALLLAERDPSDVQLAASAALALASLMLLRSVVPGARRELIFDGSVLGLGVATVWTGFLVVPALDGPGVPLAGSILLSLGGGATAFAAVCSSAGGDGGGHKAVERLLLAQMLLLAAGIDGVGAVPYCIALTLAAAALLAAVAVRPRAAIEHDHENDGADDAVRRHLLAPIACMTVFPASLVAVLILRGPSTLEVALWGATWSIAGLLVFARQNWLLGDRHRAVSRERDLRREMVRRNAELAALTDLADAITRVRKEDDLVDRGLHVLLRAADALSAHIALAGDRRSLPPGAELPAGDPHALTLPLVVRDEQLGSVTLAGRGVPFEEESRRLVGLLADQLAVGLSHLRDYNEKSHQALRDPLTGIYNRRVLQDALSRELLRAARDAGEVSLTLLDIDDFKAINDVHGHDAGDEVLRRVAACGREVVRPGDTFARIGGEEFALLTPGAGAQEALLIAERLRLAVAALEVLPDRNVTVSAGLAAWPADARDGDTLRRAADEALYRAKAAGKNRCELAGGAPTLA
jgi:diguanylate cyclase (GGDEF)-like protein